MVPAASWTTYFWKRWVDPQTEKFALEELFLSLLTYNEQITEHFHHQQFLSFSFPPSDSRGGWWQLEVIRYIFRYLFILNLKKKNKCFFMTLLNYEFLSVFVDALVKLPQLFSSIIHSSLKLLLQCVCVCSFCFLIKWTSAKSRLLCKY